MVHWILFKLYAINQGPNSKDERVISLLSTFRNLSSREQATPCNIFVILIIVWIFWIFLENPVLIWLPVGPYCWAGGWRDRPVACSPPPPSILARSPRRTKRPCRGWWGRVGGGGDWRALGSRRSRNWGLLKLHAWCEHVGNASTCFNQW